MSVGVLGWSSAASAHAVLLSSNPLADEVVEVAPRAVELTFSEAVDVGLGGVEVLDPDGNEVSDGPVREEDATRLTVPMESAELGTHTVVWRVTSADGHTIEGSFVFHVGERRGGGEVATNDDTSSTIARWIGRFTSFLGLVLIVGALGWDLTTGGRDVRARRLLPGVLVIVGGAIELWVRTAEATGRSFWGAVAQIPDAATTTRFGILELIQIGAGVAIVIGWTLRRRRLVWLMISGASAAAAVLATSVGGHAWTSLHRGTAVLADSVHLLTAGLWLGGLVALTRGSHTSDEDIRRFSHVALGSVLVLGASGALSTLEHLDSFSDLWSTGYGRLVLAKIVVFAIVVAFGILNRQILLPRLVDLAARLRSILRVEIAIGVLAVGLAAALVDVPPPTTTTNEPFAATRTVDDVFVDLSITPAAAGSNQLHLTFQPVTGSLAERGTDAVEVRVGTDEIPSRRVEVEAITSDHFVAEDVSFSSGTWLVEITAVREGVPLVTSFEVPIQ